MSDYITVHNVPLVDEHVMTDEDGHPVLDVDEKVLHRIAARNNQRVRETGDLVPTIIGHTKGEVGEHVPEDQQPPILDAWWSNFKVIPFLNTGRKCVAASFKFHKSLKNKLKRFPRRSVELWLGDWKIDPVALLGATTPSRDLGLLRLAADGRKVYRRVLPAKDHMNEELVQAVVKALEQTDVFQYCRKKMEEESAGADGGLDGQDGLDGHDGLDGLDGQDGGPPPAGDYTDGHDGEDGLDGADGLDEEQQDGKKPVKMSGAACASGTNTMTPDGNGPMKKKKHQVPARYQASGEVVKLSKLAGQVPALVREVKSLRLKLSQSERAQDLLELQAEGIEMDVQEELADVARMDDATYAKHLGRIRARYSRSLASTATDWNAVSRQHGGGTPAMSRDQKEDVVTYASEKGISFEKALTELGLS